jgi:hypothetical protein
VVWGGVITALVATRLAIPEPARIAFARVVLGAMSAGELVAGLAYLFRAPAAARRAGRPYQAAYHGVMQDFGFYNLALAALFAIAAWQPSRYALVIWVGFGLYVVHGSTHVLRSRGWYYGGERPLATRGRNLELRDALQLLAAAGGLALFYPW